MKHIGVLAHSIEGGALFLGYLGAEGGRRLGTLQHPDVTLDCIARGQSIGAWERRAYD
jgi:aspartate racemase